MTQISVYPLSMATFHFRYFQVTFAQGFAQLLLGLLSFSQCNLCLRAVAK